MESAKEYGCCGTRQTFPSEEGKKLQVLSRARIQSQDKLAGADCIDKVGWATYLVLNNIVTLAHSYAMF